jgi:hypothetical protein
MTTTPGSSYPALPVSRGLLITSAALVAGGAIVAAAGVVLGTATLVSALRRWSKTLPTPPRELARQRLNQAKIARAAAMEAWRTGGPAGSTPPLV